MNKNKFTKDNGDLVLRIPLKQENYDAIGERICDADNLVGIIAGEEYSISYLNALGYKDDIQEGMPVIMFDSKEELEEVCNQFNLEVWTHSVCAYCNEAIRGAYHLGEKGNMCYGCELKNE